jgi:hypothetical protein
VTCAPDEACDPSDGQCVSVGDGCVVLLECAGACALDETCVNGCKATASVEAVVLFDAAIGCLLTECPTFESNCFDAAEAGVCATAWQACKVDGAACTDASCDDGDPCTADACDPLVGCSNEGVTCDDGDPCTADSCDPVDGCSYASACDDGDPCTDDSCDASGCQHEPVVCAPGSVCVPEAASCVVPKGGLGCASAVACALACANDVDCVNDCNNQAAGAALSAVDSVMGCILVACGDFDSTCAEQALAATCADAYGICSGIFGSCDLDPCDDGDPCTEDLCDGGLGCLYGPVTCADGSACTTATGSCSAVVTSCAETLSGCLSQCLADDNAPWTCHDTCAGLQPPTPALSALTVCLADACPAGAGASCASTALLPGGACADAATTCIAGVPGDIDGDGVLDTVDPCPYDPAPACLDPASTSCKTAFNDCMFACLDDGLDADFCAPACTTSNMSAAAAAGLLAVQSCITGQCAPGAGASCNTTAVTIHCSSKVLDCYAIEAVCDPAECDDGDPCTTNECGEGGGCIFPPLECPDGASCDPGAGGCVAATKPCGDDIYGCYVPCMAQGGESIACQDGCGPNTSPTLGELASCVAEVCPGPVFNCYSSAMGFGGPCADLHNECLHPTDTDDDGLPDNGDPCPYDPTPDCSGPGELSCALLYSCLESCVMAGSTGLSCAGSCPPAETSSEVSGALLDVGFCMQQNCTAFSEPTCVEDLASLDGPCGTQVTACVLPGVDCSAAACDDGDACTDDTCDSIGTCYHKSNGQCGP